MGGLCAVDASVATIVIESMTSPSVEEGTAPERAGEVASSPP